MGSEKTTLELEIETLKKKRIEYEVKSSYLKRITSELELSLNSGEITNDEYNKIITILRRVK